MKRRTIGQAHLLTIIAVIAACLGPATGSAFILTCGETCLPDDPGNFGGMYWGQYLGELKGMTLVSTDPKAGESYYVRRDDVLELDRVKLEYVQYGFWQDMYSSIAFGTSGAKNWQRLKEICFRDYGPWRKSGRYPEKYLWVGRHSAMTLEYHPTYTTAQLYIYSKVIYERQLAISPEAGAWVKEGFRRK
jgi:hypothetical protein